MQPSCHPRCLHSFPTRRSSDLCRGVLAGAVAPAQSDVPARGHDRRAGGQGHASSRVRQDLPDRQVRHRSQRQALRSEEHTSELQSHSDLVCRLLPEKKNNEPAAPRLLTLPCNQAATPAVYTLSLHDALPIYAGAFWPEPLLQLNPTFLPGGTIDELVAKGTLHHECARIFRIDKSDTDHNGKPLDRKSTRLNSSHTVISYAVFCRKKKTMSRPHRDCSLCHATKLPPPLSTLFPYTTLFRSMQGRSGRSRCSSSIRRSCQGARSTSWWPRARFITSAPGSSGSTSPTPITTASP